MRFTNIGPGVLGTHVAHEMSSDVENINKTGLLVENSSDLICQMLCFGHFLIFSKVPMGHVGTPLVRNGVTQ